MEKSGPRNIGLSSIIHYRFPITAISSILHRISGVILFLFVPFVIWVLDLSLSNQESFEQIKHCLLGWPSFFIWLFLSALAYHLFAGVRHLIMDIGFGEGKISGKIGSYLVIVLGVLFAVALGVCLWV
ncbi:succinate dehydrogenase, cytochrome b556 subunit [Thiotrichales bacterium 19S11-10]|nr:succinate dehydrogenase, cytochrome b556 subunit [Thiotrichales bacterium 19S11-10]MCF6807683.1 succinate dehydrogenase, cytochrome b556 subunit [Thiotrichales bacterium 19S9-11]MCF6811652.1 succinate dehydrogenase, cytochrome b556 subunit [Thiotrichales bacterium 19S9-12]